MTAARAIVLDANILIRFALGARVPALLGAYFNQIDFLTPTAALEEAHRHVPAILNARSASPTAKAAASAALVDVTELVRPVPLDSCLSRREAALARIGRRDPRDWPVLACALLMDCPIWTEDRDFFGTGVATWMTATVEIYLAGRDEP